MLMNGKEVNNLVLNGVKFTRTFDDYIGKKVMLHNRAPIWGYCGASYIIMHQHDECIDWGAEPRSYFAQKQTTTIVGWYINLRNPEDKDDFFGGLWLQVDHVIDTAYGQWGKMWISAKNVTFID